MPSLLVRPLFWNLGFLLLCILSALSSLFAAIELDLLFDGNMPIVVVAAVTVLPFMKPPIAGSKQPSPIKSVNCFLCLVCCAVVVQLFLRVGTRPYAAVGKSFVPISIV